MGNERADDLAKEGAEADLRDPVPDLPKMPFSKMKALMHSKALEVWTKEWNENLYTKYNHRQTKNFREKPDGKAARELVQNNSRITFSQTLHSPSMTTKPVSPMLVHTSHRNIRQFV